MIKPKPWGSLKSQSFAQVDVEIPDSDDEENAPQAETQDRWSLALENPKPSIIEEEHDR